MGQFLQCLILSRTNLLLNVTIKWHFLPSLYLEISWLGRPGRKMFPRFKLDKS
jgi:hypothetical protein